MAARIIGSHGIPGPPRRSLAGYRRYIRALDRKPLAYLQSLFEAYGPVSALVAGDARLVFALGSAANQQLLAQTQLRRPHPHELGEPGWASVTIQQLSAAERSEQDVQPLALAWQSYLAQQQASGAYGEAVVRCTAQMVEPWGLGQQLDLVYVLRRLNVRILLETLLQVDTTSDAESELLLHHWLHNISAPPLRCHMPGLIRRRERRLLASIAIVMHSTAPGDFLSALGGERERGESDGAAEVLYQQIVQLVNAIEAPLTSALTWTLLLLSQHERVLSDVRAELRATLHGAPPTVDQLATAGTHLPLMERVIKESLRLLPPRCFGLRQTTAPLELLSYALPPHATLVFSPLLTHRLASLFVSPWRFRPERWLYIEPSSDEYLPLGPAASSSLSFSFLLLHMKLMLATLLDRSRLVLAAGARIDYRLQPVFLPKAELPMIVAPLERKLIRREVRGEVSTLVDFGSS